MKILVLGGTRFIGKSLVARLAAEKHDVHVLSRHDAPGATVHKGDRRDAALLSHLAAAGFETVIDFLGMNGSDSQLAVDAFRGRTSRFVHISTGAIYWVQNATRCPWIESDDALPLRDRARADAEEYDYGIAKRECETVLRTAAREGFPAVIVRAPVVSGPGDWRRRDLYWVRRLLEKRPCVMPDGGHNVFNHVYVDDLVSLLAVLAVDRTLAPGEAFNACDRVFTSLREYVGWFADILGVSATLVDVPRAAIQRAGLHDRSFFFADTKSHVLDNRKAEARFGKTFRTPDAWIPPTAEWCRAQAPDPAEDARLAAEARLVEALR